MAETETVDAPAVETAPAPSAPPAWRASLPDDLRGEKSLDSFKGQDWGDVGPALVKSYVETKKLVGQRVDGMVKVPGATAAPEDVAAFHKALGVPDSPDQYTIQRPDIALNGGWNEQAEKEFLAVAHKHGMTPTQVQQAINFYGAFEGNKLAAAQRQANEVMATLRREWGPNYDANLGRANRAVQQFGGDELISYLAESGLGRHPAMVKTFVNIANAMVESGALETGGDIGLDSSEAKTKAQAIRADKTHPFNQPGHPDHERAVEELLTLERIALGRDNKVVASFREA